MLVIVLNGHGMTCVCLCTAYVYALAAWAHDVFQRLSHTCLSHTCLETHDLTHGEQAVVAICSTGDELAEVDAPVGSLPRGTVRDSNRAMLIAACQAESATVLDMGIVGLPPPPLLQPLYVPAWCVLCAASAVPAPLKAACTNTHMPCTKG